MTATAPAVPASASFPHFEELLIRADRAAVITTLARGMAHDLRGPLQALTLIVDPHADLLGGPEAGRLRLAVGSAVQHLTDTIGRFSQVYTPSDPEPSPVIVDDVISAVADLQRYQRSLPAAEVELRMPGGLPPVRAAEADLRHLLLSLIVNAKQAFGQREDGRILLAATADDAMVRVIVEDNGPGLDGEARSRVFEPFYTTRTGQMGVGLTVARWLAERSGGSLVLEDGDSGGLRAVVELPSWRRGGA